MKAQIMSHSREIRKEDPIDLDQSNAEKRKCFKYGKTRHIRRFCKNKEKNLVVVDSGNEKILNQKGDQEADESL